jgi:hypothetical protein
LALYYYSNGRPAEEVTNAHSTVFQARPGEDIKQDSPSGIDAKTIIKKLVPPILLEARDYLTKKDQSKKY